MTFKEWIQGYTEMDHPFAELAKAIYESDDFPTDDDYEKIIDFVNENVDCENKSYSLENAIEEYKSYKK